MKNIPLILTITLTFLLLFSTSAQGAVITLSEKHLSIDVPSDWYSERNYSIDGVVYDLYFQGPNYNWLGRPTGTILTMPWLGNITDHSLYVAMTMAIDGLKSAFGNGNVEILLAPLNITINGEKASIAHMVVSTSGTFVWERLVMIASNDWKELCALAFAVTQVQTAMYTPDFDGIMYSLTFSEKALDEEGLLMTLSLMIIGVGVAACVVIVVVVSRMKKKQSRPMRPDEMKAEPPAPPPK